MLEQSLNEQLTQLHALAQHPGWKLFVAQMEQSEQHLYHTSVQSRDAHSMARALGGYATVKDLKTWLERQMKALQDALVAQP